MTAMPWRVGEYIRSQGRSNSIERHMNGFAMKNVWGVYFSFLVVEECVKVEKIRGEKKGWKEGEKWGMMALPLLK